MKVFPKEIGVQSANRLSPPMGKIDKWFVGKLTGGGGKVKATQNPFAALIFSFFKKSPFSSFHTISPKGANFTEA